MAYCGREISRISYPMILLDEFKKSLGPLADTLSENETLALREKLDRLADIVFDFWLQDRNKLKLRQKK